MATETIPPLCVATPAYVSRSGKRFVAVASVKPLVPLVEASTATFALQRLGESMGMAPGFDIIHVAYDASVDVHRYNLVEIRP